MTKKQGILRILLILALTLTLVAAITPASAACLVKDLESAANTLTNSNNGSANDDLIFCTADDQPTANVRGLAGNDTILVYDDPTDPGTRDIVGGDVAVPGNDTIVVFEDAAVQDIAGDRDTTGGNNSGDDQITLHGTARYVYGDEVRTVTTTTTGGDDIIDVTGTTSQSVIGDGIFVSNNNENNGGHDVITIHAGATVGNDVMGDYMNSTNSSSAGGSDIIVIRGTVMDDVFGDYIVAGQGGNDTIIVASGGRVGTSGTTQHIFGDYRTNSGTVTRGGGDDILVEGQVYGGIYGDYMQTSAGSDDITVGASGNVHGNVYGDYMLGDSASNATDYIQIIGDVGGLVAGDGNRGNGANDTIYVDYLGDVGGNLYGDGTTISSGNANGGSDRITIKGDVDGDLRGDQVDGNGGNDVIVIQGHTTFTSNSSVDGALAGDGAGGNGGNDQIYTTQYSQVRGGIFGDNQTRTGGNGGNDKIFVDGRVGTSSSPESVYGDKVNGDGGEDFIHILANGLVYGAIVGDDVNGLAGEDLIWVDGEVQRKVIGDSAGSGNKKDRIAVRQGGVVGLDVVGDGSAASNPGGWDTMNIIGGSVGRDFIGDDVGGNAKGGNDFMAIRMNGSVARDFIGDLTNNGNGGNDTMTLINGTVGRDMIGDDVGGNGGDDTMNVLVAGTVVGDLIGDKVGVDKTGGNDSIFISGKVNGRIYGDLSVKNGFSGADNIQTNPSSVIGQGIWGDNTKGAGKKDIIKVNGKINANGIRGDVVNGKGGNDDISVFSFGDVTGNVMGDDSNGPGGNDTILVDEGGRVAGNVWGDYSQGKGGNDSITIAGLVTGNVEGDHQKGGTNINGGDDTIVIENTGQVNGSVFGDNVGGAGGNDKIDVKGTVNGNVLGDNVGGSGGNDIIRIFPAGVVGGSVCGFNFCNNNPGDSVVFLDEDANPALDSADTIIIAGKVLGNVIAGTFYGSNADDQIVVFEGAEIGGTVYAGDETNGDSFVYVESIINEEKTVDEAINAITSQDITSGKVTVNGTTFTLDNVEIIDGTVGQISCFGMDYRMNKSSDGCSARSQAEKDAIQWHRNNPGFDGRLPGLEGCAVYPYGDALRVYEIMDGAEGELVAEIWGNVLSDAPAANELLGATADGNVALYHLASGELQVECRNLVDGKVQVRVLSDLAGTVVNAYDKS